MPGRGNRRETPHLYRARGSFIPASRRRAAPISLVPPPSLKPPTGSRGGLRGSNLSRSPGPPPPPGLVFPSSGGWARGWGARRVGARSGSRVGAGTRSWLWRRQARRSLIGSCPAKGANKRVEEVPPQRRREEERRGPCRYRSCVLAGGKGGEPLREGDARWPGVNQVPALVPLPN